MFTTDTKNPLIRQFAAGSSHSVEKSKSARAAVKLHLEQVTGAVWAVPGFEVAVALQPARLSRDPFWFCYRIATSNHPFPKRDLHSFRESCLFSEARAPLRANV